MLSSRSGLILAILVASLLVVAVLPSYAGEQTTPLEETAGYFKTNFGIAFKTVQLEISDTDSLKTVALLEGKMVPWPYFGFQSSTRYFGNSRWGWLMEYGLSGFSIDKQSEPFSEFEAKDRGTGADGWFLYAMPTFTWDATASFRIGLGLGGGIMSVKGDAFVYDSNSTLTRLEYDLTELTWGGYGLTEYLFGNFMFGIHAGILITEKNPYDYSVTDGSFIIAYHRSF